MNYVSGDIYSKSLLMEFVKCIYYEHDFLSKLINFKYKLFYYTFAT